MNAAKARRREQAMADAATGRPRNKGISRIAYVGLRCAHMFFSFAILPVAILYLKQGGYAAHFHGAVLVGAVTGAVLWALFYILLSHFAFPTSLWGAAFTTLGIYGNGLAGASLGSFDLYYAAYAVAWCALVAQVLAFLAFVVIFFFPAWRRKHLGEIKSSYGILLLVCLAGLGLFAWLMHRPFVDEWLSEPRLWLRLVFVFGFAWQLYAEIETLYRSSVLNDAAGRQDKTVWKIYESYMPVTAAGLAASLVAALLAALL